MEIYTQPFPGEGWQPMPAMSDRAAASTPDELLATYGNIVLTNHALQDHSVARVQESAEVMRAAREAADSSDASPDPFAEEFKRLRKEAKELARQRTDSPEAEAAFVAVIQERYNQGHITLANKREALVGKARIQEIAKASHKATFAPFEARLNDGTNTYDRRTITATRNALDKVIKARTADMLLAAPDETQLDAYVSDVMQTVSALVADLSMTPWVDNFPPEQLEQLTHEYLNLTLYPGYQVELNVGIGGSETAPSVRMPAFVTPALQHLQTFVDRGVSNVPTLRIFNAYQLSAQINGLDQAAARSNALITEAFLAQYIERYFPDCLPFVYFEQIDTSDVFSEHFAADVSWLQTTDFTEAGMVRALAALGARGLEHGGQQADGYERTLQYAAAHPQIFRNYHVGDMGPDAVIKFGGHGEDNFNVVQAAIVGRRFAEGTPSDMCLTNTGGHTDPPQPIFAGMKWNRMPGYYPSGEHEVTITDGVVDSLSWDKLTERYAEDWRGRNDLEVLQIHSDYINFLSDTLQRLRMLELTR